MLGYSLLALALWATADASWRLSSQLVPRGTERALCALTLGAAAIVIEMLTLGCLDLSGDPRALLGVSLALALSTRLVAPAPKVRPADEVTRWLASAGTGKIGAAGLVVGLIATTTVYVLYSPVLGSDAEGYHLATIVGWAQEGNAGAAEAVERPFPVEAFPRSNEALVGWAVAISGSPAAALIWSPLALAVLWAAALALARALGVGRRPAALALLAAAIAPVTLQQLNGPGTDLPSTMWLVVCATLVVSSQLDAAHRRLFPAAIVAAGLAAGTKTTVIPLLAIVIAVGVVRLGPARGTLRRLSGLAGAIAVAVGGVWYLRNLIQHGTPVWPFSVGPLKAERPAVVDLVDVSLFDRPRATLEGRVDLYLRHFGGLVVPLLAWPLLAAIARDRWARGAALAFGASILLWAAAPQTGISSFPGFAGISSSTIRYLLAPCLLGLGVMAATAGTDRRGRVAWALLAAAVLVSLAAALETNWMNLPPLPWLALGGLAGAALALAFARLASSTPAVSRLRVAVAAATATSVVTTALVGGSFLERYARTSSPGAGLATALLDTAGEGDRRSIHFNLRILAPLAGNELERELALIPEEANCAAIARLGETGWLVLSAAPFAHAADCSPNGRRPAFSEGDVRVYPPERAADT